MAGKWLDDVLKENVPHILPKVLWWIHELHDHCFQLDHVKHLPLVAAAMLDSHVTEEYWKTRTRDYLRYLQQCIYYVCMCVHVMCGSMHEHVFLDVALKMLLSVAISIMICFVTC